MLSKAFIVYNYLSEVYSFSHLKGCCSPSSASLSLFLCYCNSLWENYMRLDSLLSLVSIIPKINFAHSIPEFKFLSISHRCISTLMLSVIQTIYCCCLPFLYCYRISCLLFLIHPRFFFSLPVVRLVMGLPQCFPPSYCNCNL